MPVPKTTPIHRAAREAAERACVALAELHEEDPFVFAALLELWWSCDDFPQTLRGQIALIRERTHELKVRAVNHEVKVRTGAPL